jgi:hypothetical protein
MFYASHSKASFLHLGALGLTAAFVLASSAVAWASAELQNSADASVVAADMAVVEHCLWEQSHAPNTANACTLHDPWQTPYTWTKQHGHFQVLSAGPDQTFGTKDDILRTPVSTD